MIVKFSISIEIGLPALVSGTVPVGVSHEMTIERMTSLPSPRTVCARSKLPTRQKLISVLSGSAAAGIVAITELLSIESP